MRALPAIMRDSRINDSVTCYAPAWEGVKGSRYDRRQSDIEAWHILKYGTAANDLFVIFLCPRCARLFSAREVNPLNLIAERFSVNLQKNQSSPRTAAFMRELASVTSDSAPKFVRQTADSWHYGVVERFKSLRSVNVRA